MFDTNVLLAGIFAHGVCEALLDAALGSDHHVFVASEYIYWEFLDRAVGKFGAPAEEARRAIQMFRGQMEIVEPLAVPADACRDPDDLPILGTLLAANADCLATGDKDLLQIQTYRSIPILSPRALLDRLI